MLAAKHGHKDCVMLLLAQGSLSRLSSLSCLSCLILLCLSCLSCRSIKPTEVHG
jgi:hypothetical protein